MTILSRIFYAIILDMENETLKTPIEVLKNEEKTGSQSFWEIVRFALLALAIVIPIRLFIAEPFVVSGSSMFPTFKNNDYLIIDKLSYRLGDPKRDDVVVFKYPNDTKKYFIKRVIGLPGETVKISGSTVTIFNDGNKNGFNLDQPYVETPDNNDLKYELKDDEYFVMGDNRTGSSDSRFWGPVKKDLLTGRALLRLLPIQHVDILPGAYTQK